MQVSYKYGSYNTDLLFFKKSFKTAQNPVVLAIMFLNKLLIVLEPKSVD